MFYRQPSDWKPVGELNPAWLNFGYQPGETFWLHFEPDPASAQQYRSGYCYRVTARNTLEIVGHYRYRVKG